MYRTVETALIVFVLSIMFVFGYTVIENKVEAFISTVEDEIAEAGIIVDLESEQDVEDIANKELPKVLKIIEDAFGK